ncbi:hypothetical protein BUY22_08050 [Staphylococcus cohnii]|nr:hypothetical protein BUY22_08050 [Staphylococcus cohnii]
MNQLNYIKHLKKNYIFFSKETENNENDELNISDSFTKYQLISSPSSIWKYYHHDESHPPQQGWKIHISANHKETQQTLDAIVPILNEYKVSFKHLKSQSLYYSSNSKNANRATSGKFITIYPQDDDEFLLLMNELEKVLLKFKKGPYILSDKRWKKSNIFYRYGGFKAIQNEEGEMCIKDNEGNLVVDKRQPFYSFPEFVKEFNTYLEKINEQVEVYDNKLEDYDISDAISFSNSGGIYKASNKKNGKQVIIKEARSNTGFDGKYRTAFDRQNIEYNALNSLKDVDGIVNVLDFFTVWEHKFLVEEFIEGDSLHSWLAKNYPFFKENNSYTYNKKIKFIINQLFDIITNIHKKDIVMGDLQPNNIIIDKNLKVHLIDFETASSTKDVPSVGLAVPSFSNSDITINKERDWYALNKILKFCLLPINTTPETDPYFTINHRKWIKGYYNDYFSNIFEQLSKHITSVKNMELQYDELPNYPGEIIEKISLGIIENSRENRYLTPNDVRQYETEYGYLDVLSGASGVLWSMLKTNNRLHSKHLKWINDYLLKDFHKVKEEGLFTGLSGIAVVLYEYGYKKAAHSIFNSLAKEDNNDISLSSGLSGIGIALLSLYEAEKEEIILQKCKNIARNIISHFDNITTYQSQNNKNTTKGLLNGWSGPSLFFTLLYNTTGNQSFLVYSKKFLEHDISNLQEDQETLQVYDENKNRLLPYLSDGSIGIGIAIKYLQNISKEFSWKNDELRKITNLHSIKATISSGLFNGGAGFLLLPPLINKNTNKNINANKNVLELFKLFLAPKDDYLIFLGESSYRFTFDLFSGSAGALLGLYSFKNNNPLLWIPCINNEYFLKFN